MAGIEKIAVIGAGVMGAGIAALAANSGVKTLLLDRVPADAEDRNILASSGIARMLATQGFVHPSKAALVTIGNLEDDLERLRDCDWIVEVVVEKLEVKQALYHQINPYRKANSIVSSNTSTLPIHTLVEGLPENFRRDFLITHFFNPPRLMRLLEVTSGNETRPQARRMIEEFCDVVLGKGIVPVKDTPGFIANRIGVYWLFLGLYEAIRLGLTVEEADAIMGKPLGIPKTGVFGLFDLIGLDLMPLIAKSMLDTLPPEDAFHTLYQESPLLCGLIAEGYTGRKGKGGFTRIRKEGSAKIKEILDLQTGAYRAVQPAPTIKGSIREILSQPGKQGEYAWSVLSGTIHYAASLIPEIADDIAAIDHAMQWGYSWKYGLFELVDLMADGDENGSDWMIKKWQREGKPVPPFFANAQSKPFYTIQQGERQQRCLNGQYQPIAKPPGVLLLADHALTHQPILQNSSARLWDIGDGIACLEFTTKMGAIDNQLFDLMDEALLLVNKQYQGLVIGHDGDLFSAGANLANMLTLAQSDDFAAISAFIKRGQQCWANVKNAPFPLVVALSGKALGGGCELTLHAGCVQAYMESQPGLVETSVGLIPAWGGCKEMLARMPLAQAFEQILFAETASSAQDAKAMGFLQPSTGITMNRARVLFDAKTKCLNLLPSFGPVKQPYPLASSPPKEALATLLEEWQLQGKLSSHSGTIAHHLMEVLNSGAADEASILTREHDAFMALIKTVETQARIEHMLKTGQPLKN